MPGMLDAADQRVNSTRRAVGGRPEILTVFHGADARHVGKAREG